MSLVKTEPSELQGEDQSDANPVVVASLSGSPTEPQLTKSANELRALSTVLHTFSLRYNDLQNHLDSIQELIKLYAEEHRCPYMGMNACNEVDEVTNSFAAESPLEGIGANEFCFSAVLHACKEVGDGCFGKQVHCLVLKHWLESDVFMGSALVDMYGECECMESAEKAFDDMPERTVVSWNSMIVGILKNG